MNAALRAHLLEGQVIPALPLALGRGRHWDERRQRAVTRYYVDAGAGGLAVGVHSTQFAIRDPRHGLYEPVLALAADTVRAWRGPRPQGKFALIAGLCGRTPQAMREAGTAKGLGYDAGLLSLGAWARDEEKAVLAHCRKYGHAKYALQIAHAGRRGSRSAIRGPRSAAVGVARQRPGTAKGFVFLTLEDETGIANIVVRPDVFERERLTVIRQPFLLIDGILQQQDGVTAVRAERVQGIQGGAAVDAHDFY
mgnify:CR=1 FL=1